MHKLIPLIVLLLLTTFSKGQNSTSYGLLSKKAWDLYQEKKYEDAGETYTKALALLDSNQIASTDRYNAACSWAMAGNKKMAYKYLDELAYQDYYGDFNQISREAAFKLLHGDEHWEKIKHSIKQNTQKIEELIPFYTIKERYYFNEEGLAKEHIPLDGNKVKMIPYRVSKRFGFVSNDTSYKWLIQPQYAQVFAVYEEGAIALDTTGAYGMVRPDGTALIPFEYAQILKQGDLYCAKTIADDSRSPEGIPTISPDDYEKRSYCLLYDYYNGEGELLFSQKLHDGESFIGDDELAWFRYGKTYYIRNKKGKIVKEIKHDGDNLFTGIADDLLIYYTRNHKDSISYRIAMSLDGEEQFRIVARYIPYNEEHDSTPLLEIGEPGVYQLSANLYGMRPKQEMAEHYFSFCDSLGEEGVLQGVNFNFSMLPIDLDYFSQEQFIVSAYRGEMGTGVINRMGDTIVPFRKYGKITQAEDGSYICWSKEGGNYIYNQKGEILDWGKGAARPKGKTIPWSADEEQLSWREENAYAQIFEYYNLEMPWGFYEGLIPLSGTIDMPVDTLERKDVYSYVGNYIYYINKQGEVELELPRGIPFAGYFSEGLAPAINKDRGLGFINRKGEWAIPPDYEIAWVGGYPISLPTFPRFKGGFAYLKGFKGYIDKNGKPLFSGERLEDKYNHSH